MRGRHLLILLSLLSLASLSSLTLAAEETDVRTASHVRPIEEEPRRESAAQRDTQNAADRAFEKDAELKAVLHRAVLQSDAVQQSGAVQRHAVQRHAVQQSSAVQRHAVQQSGAVQTAPYRARRSPSPATAAAATSAAPPNSTAAPACRRTPSDGADARFNFWQQANVTAEGGLSPEHRFYSPVVYIERSEGAAWVLAYGGARLESRVALQSTHVLVLEQPAFWMLLSEASPPALGPRFGHSLTTVALQPLSPQNASQSVTPLLFGGCEYFDWAAIATGKGNVSSAGTNATTAQQCHNDLWLFDEVKGWHELAPSQSTLPPARRWHAAARLVYTDNGGDVDECLVVFGGADADDRALGDTWLFHVAERRWVPLGGGGAPATAMPSPRFLSASALLHNRLYLLGGRDDAKGKQFSDFWSLELTAPGCAAAAWRQHDYPAWAPQNVSDTTLTGNPMDNALVLHSGIRRRLLFDPNTWRWTNDSGTQLWTKAPVQAMSSSPPARSVCG